MATAATTGGTDGDGDVESRSVTVDGDLVHYLTAGDGDRDLVLLHGGIIDAAHVSWGGSIGPLADGATVYAPDFPGYGESPLPNEPLTVERHVRTIAAFLEELDLEDAVVAGISMGGGVAIGLGLREPDRLAHVVALDAFGLGSELSNGLLTWFLAKVQVTNHVSVALLRRSRRLTRLSLGNIAHDVDALSDEAVDAVYREVQRPNAGAAFRSFRAAEVTRHGYRTDYSDHLAELSVPTRLIHGEHDEVIPLSWSERAAERIPDADLFVLDDCAHWPTRERPDAVHRLVSEFL